MATTLERGEYKHCNRWSRNSFKSLCSSETATWTTMKKKKKKVKKRVYLSGKITISNHFITLRTKHSHIRNRVDMRHRLTGLSTYGLREEDKDEHLPSPVLQRGTAWVHLLLQNGKLCLAFYCYRFFSWFVCVLHEMASFTSKWNSRCFLQAALVEVWDEGIL